MIQLREILYSVKRGLKNLYIWIKSKTMQTEEKYKILKSWGESILLNLEANIKQAELRGYISYTSSEDCIVKFKVGTDKYLIEMKVNPQVGYTIYQTYELHLNLNDVSSYKALELPSMRAYTDLSCSSKIQGVENIKTRDFGSIYLQLLLKYIEDKNTIIE